MNIFSINMTNKGMTKYVFEQTPSSIGKSFALFPDGVYLVDNTITSVNQEISTGFVRNNRRSYTFDAYLDREPESITADLQVTSKEGATQLHSFTKSWTKTNLSKGMSSKYFKYTLTFTEAVEFKELAVLLEESKRML